MRFLHLAALNVWTRKVRTVLTGLAVAISIMTVVTMGILTHSLRQSAISVLRTGTADFSIGQKGVSDVIYSSLDEADIAEVRSFSGIESAIGVFVDPIELDSDHPFFLQLGLVPEGLEDFGVQIVAGRAFTAEADDEVILGARTAREFGKAPGDAMVFGDTEYRVVGIYTTGQVFGDSAAMFPLADLQARDRKPGVVTLIFVRTSPGTDIDPLRLAIESARPELATVRTESEFGRIDRNLQLISAANTGVSGLALFVGAVSILNTVILSVFERTREFGLLRAVGWPRWRILLEIMTEASFVSFVGAMFGIAGGFVAVQLLREAPSLVGVFQPSYPASVFGRALGIAFAMAALGSLYPAVRAANLRPLTALRHE